MELLITNIEQQQPRDYNGTLFKIFGRDESGEAHEVTVHGFEPYFYAPADEVDDLGQRFLLEQQSIKRLDAGGYQSLRGRELVRVIVPYPQNTRDAREHFDEHYSADVPFVRRFMIDAGIRDIIEVPADDVHWTEISPVEPGSPGSNPRGNASKTTLQNVRPRVVTLDIEVDDSDGFPVAGKDRILSVVGHDSYTDETVAWVDLDGRAIEDTTLHGVDKKALGLDEIRFEPNEKQMLINFFCWVDEMDPDLLTGWNVDDFDITHLIKRGDSIGASPDRMSRMGWSGISNRGDPRVKGRTIYDLLTVYDKNQFTELDSYKLDDIAQKELGSEKIHVDSSVWDLYEHDVSELLRYNARDVELTVGIDREAGVIDFRDVLRREVGLLFGDSYDNKDIVDMMCRRKLFEWGLVGPSRPSWEDTPEVDFEGAYVFDAFTGVAEDVVAMDLASLYPYTMAMLNASPETKVGSDYDGPTTQADNGQRFALDKQGLFPELVDDAIGLKSEYKEKLQAAESNEAREKWETKYNVAKTITNSVYGVTGWERFFLFDVDVAEAVTLTGQAVIRETANFFERNEHEVIYGDTDSVYVVFNDEHVQPPTPAQYIEEAKVGAGILNDEVYPTLATDHGVPAEDNLWEIEVEMYAERFFQAGKKKRYAYLATWKDGHWIDDPKPTIKGFEIRRSDAAQITNDTQRKIFEAILSGNEDEVSTIIYEAAREVTAPDPDYDYIGIPSGLGQEIDPEHAGEDGYYAFSEAGYPQGAHPRGCWNANKILGTNYGNGDKPKRIYLREKYFDEVDRQINVICFDEASTLEPIEDSIAIDVDWMLRVTIGNPVGRIVDAIGTDVSAAMRGQKQTGLGAFG